MFSSKDFRKVNSALNQVDRAANSRIGREILGDSLSRKLGKASATVRTVSNIVNRIDNTLLSGADNGFFTREGVGTSQYTAASIEAKRLASNLTSGEYSLDVQPEAKISGADLQGNLQFPPDMGEYFMHFRFFDYDRPDPFSVAKKENPFTIFLPIPSQLLEFHTSNWVDVEQGILGNAYDQIKAIYSGEQSISDIDLASQAGAYTFNAVQNFTSAVGNITGLGENAAVTLLQQYIGASPNPALAVIFMGPTLRDFAFSWRFHPETPEESLMIKKIISQFKKEMLPNLKYKDALNLLGFPRIAEIKLYPDEYLFPIKRCAVTNINANYAPNGVPSFFKGTKAPTVIEFVVQLKEIEYFLAEDFGRDSGEGIGVNVSGLNDYYVDYRESLASEGE